MPKNKEALSQPAYEHLLNLILTRQLKPGDRIPEVRVADEFGISRTPVRDAMRQLAGDGLITIYPNRFAQVSEYSPVEIREVGMMCISMDTMAIRLALLFGSMSDFMYLKKIAQDCVGSWESRDEANQYRLDCMFHKELARIGRNTMLQKFMNELYLRVRFIMVHYQVGSRSDEKWVRQHLEIVEALMNYDGGEALRLMVDHLSTFFGLGESLPEQFFLTEQDADLFRNLEMGRSYVV